MSRMSMRVLQNGLLRICKALRIRCCRTTVRDLRIFRSWSESLCDTSFTVLGMICARVRGLGKNWKYLSFVINFPTRDFISLKFTYALISSTLLLRLNLSPQSFPLISPPHFCRPRFYQFSPKLINLSSIELRTSSQSSRHGN